MAIHETAIRAITSNRIRPRACRLEGEICLLIWPDERRNWRIRRLPRNCVMDPLELDGEPAAYRIVHPETREWTLVADIGYEGPAPPERIIRIADVEDDCQRGTPSVAAAIEPARRLYRFMLGWTDLQDVFNKLGYLWKYDPQVRGVAEPDYDDDTGILRQNVAQREGGLSTMVDVITTAGRTEGLDKALPLLQAIATAMNLTVSDFGDSRSANRANAETLETAKLRYMRIYQRLWRDAYQRILEYMLPEGAEWELRLQPMENVKAGSVSRRSATCWRTAPSPCRLRREFNCRWWVSRARTLKRKSRTWRRWTLTRAILGMTMTT